MPLIDLPLEDWRRCLSAMKNYKQHLIEQGNAEKANEVEEVIQYLDNCIRKAVQ